MGVVWPSLDLSQDSKFSSLLRYTRQVVFLNLNSGVAPSSTPGVLVSSSFLLTAGLTSGQRARVFPLSGLASVKLPPGIPSLRNVQEAGSIRLREILIGGRVPQVSIASGSNNQQPHWLNLAAREILGM